MKYLLDTNTCIQILRTKGNPHVKTRIGSHPLTDLALCSVVVGELYYGARRASNPTSEIAKVDLFVARFTSFPFDDAAARVFADVRADLDARGLGIGPLDTMIAAIASAHGLILVTHNTKDFSRIPGLALEDWEVP
ncbi:MAG TPA: type II toxin-antitoxin system VapC family toxin [Fimbriiglobus sp.]|jgi:tRNA(fMet)-specific endonuclease VapC|nr:type II toxin-antitoxin system VapC family toxin [Fimbriiglobus sp.]